MNFFFVRTMLLIPYLNIVATQVPRPLNCRMFPSCYTFLQSTVILSSPPRYGIQRPEIQSDQNCQRNRVCDSYSKSLTDLSIGYSQFMTNILVPLYTQTQGQIFQLYYYDGWSTSTNPLSTSYLIYCVHFVKIDMVSVSFVSQYKIETNNNSNNNNKDNSL